MLSKNEIIAKAHEFGFDEVGFATVEPFDAQREILEGRQESYSHLNVENLLKGMDPKEILPEAKSMVVMLDYYLRESFDPVMETHFGRLYIDEDRIFKEERVLRSIEFVKFLRDSGLKAKASGALPARACAGRAGIGSVGKNCIMYSSQPGYENSWVIVTAILLDEEYQPDQSKDADVYDCPDWCKNACIMACPTGALKGPRHLDPRRCISNMSYNAEEITPMEFREAMGLWVYGCDRCQEICPRNGAWKVKEKPVNKRVADKAEIFALPKLLHMDQEYYSAKVWPHMFYISKDDLWLWKMNVARVMGNTRDQKYLPDLIKAFKENDDERVTGMIAWAMGRLGGANAKNALEDILPAGQGSVKNEIQQAIDMC